ncbi:MAG: hypothetical protein LBE22_10305 [Azoarcus sp.]|nr:hypothetical protein [Azoarcus sp.]
MDSRAFSDAVRPAVSTPRDTLRRDKQTRKQIDALRRFSATSFFLLDLRQYRFCLFVRYQRIVCVPLDDPFCAWTVLLPSDVSIA